jgi:hypothetical protein
VILQRGTPTERFSNDLVVRGLPKPLMYQGRPIGTVLRAWGQGGDLFAEVEIPLSSKAFLPVGSEYDGLSFDRILTPEQLDGLACSACGRRGGPLVPIGHGPQGQLFVCEGACSPSHPPGRGDVLPQETTMTPTQTPPEKVVTIRVERPGGPDGPTVVTDRGLEVINERIRQGSAPEVSES